MFAECVVTLAMNHVNKNAAGTFFLQGSNALHHFAVFKACSNATLSSVFMRRDAMSCASA